MPKPEVAPRDVARDGSATKIKVKKRKDRVDDAVHATRGHNRGRHFAGRRRRHRPQGLG
jgi:hypothetical protein